MTAWWEWGGSSGRNSCSHSHSFWEVVHSGQEMSWHFGLGVSYFFLSLGLGRVGPDPKYRKA